MKAVIIAGGVNHRSLYPGYEPGWKALVELAGRPLLSYVVEALGPEVEEFAVVGDEASLAPVTGTCRYLPAGPTLVESFIHALEAYPDEPYVLLVPADLPLLRGAMIRDFLDRCQARPGGDFYLSMVRAEKFRPPFDRVRKYMSPFRDGAMCHGNLALANPGLLQAHRAMARIEPIYQQRLNPIRSALAVGPGLGVLYLLGVHFFHRLRLETFARLASRHFGLKLYPVLCPYPELAVDVDEEVDFEVVSQVLAD